MSRLRWAHACGCVLAHWAVTVPRAVRPDGRGNRRERSSGPLVPSAAADGTSRPRKPFRHKSAVRNSSSTATIGCAVFSIFTQPQISAVTKFTQPRVAVLLKLSWNRRLKWGERPVGGAGRSWGMGKIKKDVVELELSRPGFASRADQTQEDQYSEYRDANHDNHRHPRPSGAGFTSSPQ